MKKLFFLFWATICLCVVSACQKSNDSTSSGQWLIPSEEVRDGGPGKDGIPAIDNPDFALVEDIDFLDEEDLVLCIKIGGEIRAYPHPVLDWHEIVNDDFPDAYVAITYCPLTGTGIGWDRTINGQVTTFGVSGLLYNSNLIPYDRKTDSNWSQMRLDCVNGTLAGRSVTTWQMLETNWGTWKKMYPNALVLTTNTGFSRDYNRYPYGTYKTSTDIFFPVSATDNRLHPKERVLGVMVNKKVKVYSFEQFNIPAVVEDSFEGVPLLVAGSETDNYIMAFRQIQGLSFVAFSSPEDASVIMKDDEGNEWNLFGEAVSGPREGTQLEGVTAFMGYWFSWAAFYPGLEIF